MTVHFICRGNVNRSKYAEAVLKSKKIPGLTVISSGINAGQNVSAPFFEPVIELIRKSNWLDLIDPKWRLTTQEEINSSDLIIFMSHDVYTDANLVFDLRDKKVEVWDIPDLWQRLKVSTDTIVDLGDKLAANTEQKVLQEVKIRVDKLAKKLSRQVKTELVEVTDASGAPTGQLATADEVDDLGLWHKGVHVVIWSKKGNAVLIQKRSPYIFYNSGKLDISLGGGAAPRETPEMAALRETFEELGIKARKNQLKLTLILRYNHYWKTYNTHSKSIVYSYILSFDHTPQIHLRSGEVADAYFVPVNQAKQLVRRHSLARLGKLSPLYAYYSKLLNSIEA